MLRSLVVRVVSQLLPSNTRPINVPPAVMPHGRRAACGVLLWRSLWPINAGTGVIVALRTAPSGRGLSYTRQRALRVVPALLSNNPRLPLRIHAARCPPVASPTRRVAHAARVCRRLGASVWPPCLAHPRPLAQTICCARPIASSVIHPSQNHRVRRPAPLSPTACRTTARQR